MKYLLATMMLAISLTGSIASADNIFCNGSCVITQGQAYDLIYEQTGEDFINRGNTEPAVKDEYLQKVMGWKFMHYMAYFTDHGALVFPKDSIKDEIGDLMNKIDEECSEHVPANYSEADKQQRSNYVNCGKEIIDNHEFRYYNYYGYSRQK